MNGSSYFVATCALLDCSGEEKDRCSFSQCPPEHCNAYRCVLWQDRCIQLLLACDDTTMKKLDREGVFRQENCRFQVLRRVHGASPSCRLPGSMGTEYLNLPSEFRMDTIPWSLTARARLDDPSTFVALSARNLKFTKIVFSTTGV